MEAERLIHESDLRDKQRAIEDRQEREEKEVKEKRRNESRDKNHWNNAKFIVYACSFFDRKDNFAWYDNSCLPW